MRRGLPRTRARQAHLEPGTMAEGRLDLQRSAEALRALAQREHADVPLAQALVEPRGVEADAVVDHLEDIIAVLEAEPQGDVLRDRVRRDVREQLRCAAEEHAVV